MSEKIRSIGYGGSSQTTFSIWENLTMLTYFFYIVQTALRGGNGIIEGQNLAYILFTRAPSAIYQNTLPTKWKTLDGNCEYPVNFFTEHGENKVILRRPKYAQVWFFLCRKIASFLLGIHSAAEETLVRVKTAMEHDWKRNSWSN